MINILSRLRKLLQWSPSWENWICSIKARFPKFLRMCRVSLPQPCATTQALAILCMHQITHCTELCVSDASHTFDCTILNARKPREKPKGDTWSNGAKVSPIFANAAITMIPNAVGGIGKYHFVLFSVMCNLVRSSIPCCEWYGCSCEPTFTSCYWCWWGVESLLIPRTYCKEDQQSKYAK